MTDQASTIRLIYPQWQGGVIANLVPELLPEDASRGYYLGAQLLNFLAPQSCQRTLQVPVSLDINDRVTERGISSRSVILEQTKAALQILQDAIPERIVTLGGECSVSVVPFTYLANKYPGDVAVAWIDAHPDIHLPYDAYDGFHALALTAILGFGDDEIINLLPGKVDPSKALIVGLRAWEAGIGERQKQLGLKGLSPSQVAQSSSCILEWLNGTGASKVLIHFDLDVLDPNDLVAGVGVEPYGLKINEAILIINDIATEYDVVGLTVSEHLPRASIKIKNMLNQLPLLKE